MVEEHKTSISQNNLKSVITYLSENKTRRKSKTIDSALNGLLGEGFHGKTYRLGKHLRGNTLQKHIHDKDIIKIKLYTSDYTEEIFLTDNKDINDFIEFILNHNETIAKEFKSTFWTTGSTKRQDFEDEISINRRVIKYYGTKATKFLTVTPITGFRNYKVIGCYINFKKKDTLYIAFGSECDNKYKMNINKLVIDILESLVILQEANYQHNDIKLDNIVRCNGRYKLIDWGQASSIEEFKFGDMICTSPIKWYINGMTAYISKYLMDYRTAMVNSPYEKSSIFREKNAQIISEFNITISNNPDIHVLHNKYKRNLDVFMLGMTLLHAVFRYNLNYEKYRYLIDRMTSLIHPWSSAKEALHYTKNYFNKNTQSIRSLTRKNTKN